MVHSGVVSCGHHVTAQLLRAVVMKMSELDVTVAVDVREGGLPSGVGFQSWLKHFRPVLFDKIDVAKRHPDVVANSLCVGRFLVSLAVTTTLLKCVPVLHENSGDLILSRLFEEEG